MEHTAKILVDNSLGYPQATLAFGLRSSPNLENFESVQVGRKEVT